MLRASLVALIAASGLVAMPAGAVTVSLSGLVINSCVLTVATPGVLAPSTAGTRLASDESGGVPATLGVIATGSAPTLTFAAPTLSAPAGSSGSTTEVRYSAAGGATQAYTASSSTTSAHLIDSFTVNARVTNPAGFASGTYTASTVVTCSQ